MNLWKIRHQQHESGWHVLLDGEKIAELDYLHDDQPVHLFKATLLTTDEDKITYGLRRTTGRDPEERLVFRCRNPDIEVADEDFLNLHEDGNISIRDMRPGPTSRPSPLAKK